MTDRSGPIDQRIVDLYHDFTHGGMTRRQLMDGLKGLAGSAAAAAALLPLLQNDYARAATVAEDDPRLTAGTLAVPGGPAGLSGYLAAPKSPAKQTGVGGARRGAVLVIHENRGLNPHIRDVVRRVALAGYEALGLDYLSPMGGTPADEDRARTMIGTLKPVDILASSRAAVAALKARPDGNGKVGALGFCWGGGAVNQLAVAEPTLAAGVAYYGRQPAADQVPSIRAPLLLHYGGLDREIDAGIPAYEQALKAGGKTYQIHVYQGANHAFNNDTNAARYDKQAADLAWSRTLAWFQDHLA